MRRTTILLPDDLAGLLDYERRGRGISTAMVVREALETYLTGASRGRERLPFAGLGRSGRRDTARKAEAILASEWAKEPRTAPTRRRR
ncbi:MAG: ribbon-helix-helix protein, CopG family [Chloroflexi bacterium]|nr:MAG: ribbon-helix-helix protein, CopG family [Chloroflexota bacterium]